MRTRSLLPKPEYPRPDRQRSFRQGVDWLNLDGAWDHLRVRFLVPRDEQPQGGLTIYGYDAGRYPLGPTVIID